MTIKRFLGAAAVAAIASSASPTLPAVAAEKTTLTALVTSSTQAPFDDLVKVFEKKHPGVTIEVKYLGGSEIAKMIDAGTPADIVIGGWVSDGKPTALNKTQASLEPPTEIYKTRDVIIMQKKDKSKIKGLKDLGDAGMKIAMAAPSSAVGAISAAVVQKYAAGENDFAYVKRVLDNVVKPQAEKESDVVDAVEAGKADAAIVYSTSADPARVASVDIPDKYNVSATYVVTVAKAAKNAKLGKEFVDLCTSKDGQAIFAKHRYLPPK